MQVRECERACSFAGRPLKNITVSYRLKDKRRVRESITTHFSAEEKIAKWAREVSDTMYTTYTESAVR